MILQNIFYINLKERVDRREHIERNIIKLFPTSKFERIDAIRNPISGAIGCSLSHIRCIEEAKKRKLPYICVMEDDILFLKFETLFENIIKFENSNIKEWDVLVIGGNVIEPFHVITDFCIQIYNTQTTLCYIVKEHYYDTLIMNFKEGVMKLMKEPYNREEYAVDMYWKKLQRSDKWFMIIPLTVTSLEDYSNIENKIVNFNHLLLDLHKYFMYLPRPI